MTRNGERVPAEVQVLLDELMHVQVLVETLPGPRLHQDHDFYGAKADLERLYGWFKPLIWIPYWGQTDDARETMLFLGGRDPWIETLEVRAWELLRQIAEKADCKLVGRGAVCPEDAELAEIRDVLPPVAAAHGWVFCSARGDYEGGRLQ